MFIQHHLAFARSCSLLTLMTVLSAKYCLLPPVSEKDGYEKVKQLPKPWGHVRLSGPRDRAPSPVFSVCCVSRTNQLFLGSYIKCPLVSSWDKIFSITGKPIMHSMFSLRWMRLPLDLLGWKPPPFWPQKDADGVFLRPVIGEPLLFPLHTSSSLHNHTLWTFT